MNVYTAINTALQLVSIGMTVQEVQARIAEEEAKGLKPSELATKLVEWRDIAISEAQAEIKEPDPFKPEPYIPAP